MSNEKQATYWNEVAGPKWVKIGDAMDARFVAITQCLLNAAAPKPGESVLDIGCGTGSTATPLAAMVTGSGHVTGIDISTPMLDLARARTAGHGNLAFLEADAQTHGFGTEAFDLLISRFGVMFFEQPAAAFANLRGALAPGGRLCFVCWAPLIDNPHWLTPFNIVTEAVGSPAPRHPHAPGPLAFSETDYIREILTEAGFSQISITPTPVSIIGESLESEANIACFMGPAGALLDEKQASPEIRDAVREKIAAFLKPFVTPSGIALPATIHLVEAQG